VVRPEIEQRAAEYTRFMQELALQPHAAVIESVTGTQETLLSLLDEIAAEDALWKPAPDEWCIRELALHAMFTERLVAKLVACTARSTPPTADDLRGAGIGMMPDDDGRPYAAVLDDIRSANAALLATIANLPDEPDMAFRMPHPFFGPLNCLEWAAFQRVHDTDHIQHAERILAGLARAR
jgi:hypothetical protein